MDIARQFIVGIVNLEAVLDASVSKSFRHNLDISQCFFNRFGIGINRGITKITTIFLKDKVRATLHSN